MERQLYYLGFAASIRWGREARE